MSVRIYLESSFISFLTARPSTQVVSLARQEFSRNLWEMRGTAYTPHVSALVLEEISRGDSQASALRLTACDGLHLLPITDTAQALAQQLVAIKAVPATEPEDALHIAIATINGMDYIASWNFVHLVGPKVKLNLQLKLRDLGFDPPTIATPEEIVEELSERPFPIKNVQNNAS